MDLGTSNSRTTAWRVFGIVAAVALYATSMSGPVYDMTTPVTMAHHELVRKTYAVIAFALLGFLLERSNLERIRGVLDAGIVLGVYSYAIEIGQIWIDKSAETFAQHSFDVLSGLAGGALGALVALFVTSPRARARRLETVAVAIGFALLAWAFTATYGRLD